MTNIYSEPKRQGFAASSAPSQPQLSDEEKPLEDLQREVLILQKKALEKKETLFKTMLKAMMAAFGIIMAIGIVCGVILTIYWNNKLEEERIDRMVDSYFDSYFSEYQDNGDEFLNSLPMNS